MQSPTWELIDFVVKIKMCFSAGLKSEQYLKIKEASRLKYAGEKMCYYRFRIF